MSHTDHYNKGQSSIFTEGSFMKITLINFCKYRMGKECNSLAHTCSLPSSLQTDFHSLSPFLSVSLSLSHTHIHSQTLTCIYHTHAYIHSYIHIHIYVYIYIYIEREREKESARARERERQRETERETDTNIIPIFILKFHCITLKLCDW